MSLPKLDKPIFSMMYPSQKREIKFRPFLVKEEKILLIAQQSGIDKDIIQAIKQILKNCVIDDKFNVDDLTTFDLEYMFLKLRSKSVSNVVTLSYEDVEDEKIYDFDVNLDEIELTFTEEHNTKIEINDSIGIIMKWPSVNVVNDTPEEATEIEITDHLIRNCIDKVYDADKVYDIKEYTEDEIVEFIDNLDVNTYEKIGKFFESLPKLKHTLKYTNSHGTERVIDLQGIRDFFTWG